MSRLRGSDSSQKYATQAWGVIWKLLSESSATTEKAQVLAENSTRMSIQSWSRGPGSGAVTVMGFPTDVHCKAVPLAAENSPSAEASGRDVQLDSNQQAGYHQAAGCSRSVALYRSCTVTMTQNHWQSPGYHSLTGVTAKRASKKQIIGKITASERSVLSRNSFSPYNKHSNFNYTFVRMP